MASTGDRSDGIRERLDARQERKAGELVQNLLDMTNPGRQQPILRREEPRGGIPQRRGYAEVNQQPGQGGAAGIAGPLIEGDAAPAGQPAGTPKLSRTYHAASQVVSSDGMFVWEMAPIDTLQLRDGKGAPLQLILADPYAQA